VAQGQRMSSGGKHGEGVSAGVAGRAALDGASRRELLPSPEEACSQRPSCRVGVCWDGLERRLRNEFAAHFADGVDGKHRDASGVGPAFGRASLPEERFSRERPSKDLEASPEPHPRPLAGLLMHYGSHREKTALRGVILAGKHGKATGHSARVRGSGRRGTRARPGFSAGGIHRSLRNDDLNTVRRFSAATRPTFYGCGALQPRGELHRAHQSDDGPGAALPVIGALRDDRMCRWKPSSQLSLA